MGEPILHKSPESETVLLVFVWALCSSRLSEEDSDNEVRGTEEE